MNLNKFTKAELISKFKKLESNNNKNSNSSQSIFSLIIQKLLLIKNFIKKLTLITFFIQIFRKYRIFAKLWLILNRIVLAIFGISLLENFAIEHIQHLFNEIRFITANIIDYFTNTNFYNYLTKLFSTKEDIPSSEATHKSGSLITRNSEQTIRSEENFTKSQGNSKISEWLKPEYTGEELKNTNENETSNNKYYYYIIGAVIISCLIWNYSEEIKTGGKSLFDWIISFRTSPSNDGGGDTNNSTTPTATNFPKSLNSEPTSPDIQLIDKGKNKVLNTSPSLDKINEQAKEVWSTSKDTSVLGEVKKVFHKYIETISPQQSIFDKVKDESISNSESSSSSMDINTPESISPSSSSSNSSTETITPEKYKKYFGVTPVQASILDKVNENWKERIIPEDNELTAIDQTVLNKLKNVWIESLPSDTKDKIKFIESNIEFIDDQMCRKTIEMYISDLERDSSILLEQIMPTDKGKIKIQALLELEVVNEMLTNWINNIKIEISAQTIDPLN